jgi:hypothetical protein
MERFFESNPGIASRVAHHVDFPDYTDRELLAIAEMMLAQWNYRFDDEARDAFVEYLTIRRQRPHFSNARSVRNALDRMRMRQALRLFEARDTAVTAEDLAVIRAPEVLASRLFDGEGSADEVVSGPADGAPGAPADDPAARPGDSEAPRPPASSQEVDR